MISQDRTSLTSRYPNYFWFFHMARDPLNLGTQVSKAFL